MALFNKKTDTKDDTAVVAEDNVSMKDLYSASAVKVEKVTKDGVKTKIAVRRHSQAYRILVRPIITEKGTGLAALGKYLFEVEYKANKIEIAKAIHELYGIKPVKVNIVRMEGKVKTRGRIVGKRKDWKKAVVTLPAGKTINVYEGV